MSTSKAPSNLRRFDHAKGTRRVVLKTDHKAIINEETLFPTRRFVVADVKRILIPGHNSRKIGARIMKGKWRGYPVFTITLPERETCPISCEHWASCYGNHMPFAKRIIPNRDFEIQLWAELEERQNLSPNGFVVRLHVLGDFYSVKYVHLWKRALNTFAGLRVFGYTARISNKDPIGRVLRILINREWDRFAIRYSGLDQPHGGAVTIEKGEQSKHVVCPAQTGKTECCSTCAFCWQSTRTVAFERH